MSIQRFEFASTDDFGNDGPAFERLEADGEYVRHEDHLSQLAALREELDQWRQMVGRICSTIPAADVLKSTGTLQDSVDYFKSLHKRLADAERRNEIQASELEVEKANAAHWKSIIAGEGQISKEARRYRGIRDILPLNELIDITADCQSSAEWDLVVDAALNPKPEAASHDE